MFSLSQVPLRFFVLLPQSMQAFAYQDGITLHKDGTFNFFCGQLIFNEQLGYRNIGKYFLLDGTVFLDMEEPIYYA